MLTNGVSPNTVLRVEYSPNNEDIIRINEKTFVSMRVYLIEEKSDELYYIYSWVMSGKYYLENNEIKQDSGSSIPHKFVVENIEGKFTVTDSIIPRDRKLLFR